VLVLRHVDAPAAKLDSLHSETEALFGCGFATQLDLAARSDDALPGKSVRRIGAQQAGDGPMVERVACGSCDLTVGRDLAPRHGVNDATEGVVALLVLAEAFFEDAALEILGNGRGTHGENVSVRHAK